MKQESKLGVMGHPTRLLPRGGPAGFKLPGASESPRQYGGPCRRIMKGVCTYG